MQIKVAVIGAGAMGMNHLRVLRDFDDEHVQLVGVAEPNMLQLRQATSRFNVEGYSDYQEMVRQTQPDLVAVVVPTYLHFEVATFLIEQGIHVLIEKPITSTIEEAQALIRLAQRCSVKIAVGHIERFNPAIIEVKKRLLAGQLGQIF